MAIYFARRESEQLKGSRGAGWAVVFRMQPSLQPPGLPGTESRRAHGRYHCLSGAPGVCPSPRPVRS